MSDHWPIHNNLCLCHVTKRKARSCEQSAWDSSRPLQVISDVPETIRLDLSVQSKIENHKKRHSYKKKERADIKLQTEIICAYSKIDMTETITDKYNHKMKINKTKKEHTVDTYSIGPWKKETILMAIILYLNWPCLSNFRWTHLKRFLHH